MPTLYEMNEKISRKVGNTLARLGAPLLDHLGVNHFYHYIITDSGQYASVGLHQSWQEYLSSCDTMNEYTTHFFQNRHNLKGLLFNQTVTNKNWKSLTSFAEKQFNVNLGLQITQSIDGGVEGFGFALNTNDFARHMALVHELPLLRLFISEYKKKIDPNILRDNFVDLNTEFGVFAKKKSAKSALSTRELALKQMNVAQPVSFSKREKEIVLQLLKGCPTSQEIAQHLFISFRTVEDHILRIKDKLNCSTKSQLILKLQELASFGFV